MQCLLPGGQLRGFLCQYPRGLYLLEAGETNPSRGIEAENTGCQQDTPNPLEQKLTDFEQFSNNIFPIWEKKKRLLFSVQKLRMGQGMSRHSRESRIQQLINLIPNFIMLIPLGITFTDSGSASFSYCCIYSERPTTFLQLPYQDPGSVPTCFRAIGIQVSSLPREALSAGL